MHRDSLYSISRTSRRKTATCNFVRWNVLPIKIYKPYKNTAYGISYSTHSSCFFSCRIILSATTLLLVLSILVRATTTQSYPDGICGAQTSNAAVTTRFARLRDTAVPIFFPAVIPSRKAFFLPFTTYITHSGKTSDTPRLYARWNSQFCFSFE